MKMDAKYPDGKLLWFVHSYNPTRFMGKSWKEYNFPRFTFDSFQAKGFAKGFSSLLYVN
jgi:hypothetical protein